MQYVAEWEQIEPQTSKDILPLSGKPSPRTSHTCTVYKNRYLVIIGGETDIINGINENDDE